MKTVLTIAPWTELNLGSEEKESKGKRLEMKMKEMNR